VSVVVITTTPKKKSDPKLVKEPELTER